MTQVFASRAELMPPGETTEDHRKWQEEDAAAVEKDRSSTGRRGGLFRGCFRAYLGRPPLMDYIRPPIIRDVEDGVDRCPRCTWELEDGLCHSCGFPSEGEEWSGSEGPEYFHPDGIYSDEDDTESALLDALLDGGNTRPGFPREFSPASSSVRSYSSEEDGVMRHYGVPHNDEHRLAVARREARMRPFPDRGSQDAGTPDDSWLEETDEGSEGDDEAGSLDGFVVDDLEQQPHTSPNFVERVPWDSGEDIEAEEAQTELSDYSDQGIESQGDNESDQNEVLSTPASVPQYRLVEDSDEGPIPPSRRQLARRSAARNSSSGEDRSPSTIAHHGRRRTNDAQRNTTGDRHMQRDITHRSRTGHTNGSSNGVPIEIDSDSDAPVSASRPTRRRRIHAPPSSEEESGAETSSGTATVGRPSPGSMPSRRQNSSTNARPNAKSSPIRIESSPRQTEMVDSGGIPRNESDADIFGRLSSLLPGSRPQRNTDLPQRASASTNDRARTSGRLFSPPNVRSAFSQINRRLSPTTPRSQHRSLASGSSHATTAQEEIDQNVRQRRALKAERKIERRRIKALRDRRRGDNSVRLASSHGEP